MNTTDRQQLRDIVKKALADLRHPWRKKRDASIGWFMSPDRGEGSFLWICAALKVKPGQIRSLVEKTVTRRVIQNIGSGMDLNFKLQAGSSR
jgi:hypothetical protein